MARLVQAPRHDGIDPSIPVDRTSITRRAGSVQIDDGVDPVRSLLYRKYSTWPCVVVVGNEMLSVLKKKAAVGVVLFLQLSVGVPGAEMWGSGRGVSVFVFGRHGLRPGRWVVWVWTSGLPEPEQRRAVRYT